MKEYNLVAKVLSLSHGAVPKSRPMTGAVKKQPEKKRRAPEKELSAIFSKF